MKCPKCKSVSLSPRKVKSRPVEVDCCAKCKGLWFDVGEIGLVLNRKVKVNYEIPNIANLTDEVCCPKCDVKLYEFCYPGTMTLVDACNTCNGIWIDNLEWEEIREDLKIRDSRMTCPECLRDQNVSDNCAYCGIIVEKYNQKQAGNQTSNLSPEVSSIIEIKNDTPSPAMVASAGMFSQIDFVRADISKFTKGREKPSGGIKSFASKISYAVSLAFKEKEIFLFSVLQLAAVAAVALLCFQAFEWIPEEAVEGSRNSSTWEGVISTLLFVCVGASAYPVGVFTGCMGAAHFLHRQGRESTVAACLNLVLPQSSSLWSFHWIDGWITAWQILHRIRNDEDEPVDEAATKEALYYAWKLGVAGVLPSMVTGNGLIQSGKNSITFVKDNFIEVAKLRAGYSALCWATVFCFFLVFMFWAVWPEASIYYCVFALVTPIAIIMLILRPIYVLALCDLYSDHLEEKGQNFVLPENLSESSSAFVLFSSLCFALMVIVIVFVMN